MDREDQREHALDEQEQSRAKIFPERKQTTSTKKVIEHPVTGERITFLKTGEETGGECSRMELRVQPRGFVATPHIHPHLEETFEILSGTFTFVVDGKERQVRAGEGATVPTGTPHAWWNSGDEEAVAIVEFRPALKVEEFFETFFGLAQNGKVSPKTGLPNLLWLAAIFRSYRDFAYISRPPLWLQLAIFTPLAAARLLGYKLPYPYPYSRPHEADAWAVTAVRCRKTATNPEPLRGREA